MAEIIGEIIGFYIFYAIFAAIFKHKVGIIIIATFSILAGLTYLVVLQDPLMLISSLAGTFIVALVKPIQIRKDKKKKDDEEDDKNNQ